MFQEDLDCMPEHNLKILVTTAYPHERLRREGMMQRIFEIDQIMENRFYISYISVGIKQNLRSKHINILEKTRELSCNFFLHQALIWREVSRVDVVYVHAVTTFILFILPLLFLRKRIIFDMHGVVPEEAVLYGRHFAASLYSLVERIAVMRSNHIIVVTRSMQRHIKNKYPEINKEFIYLPIFSGTHIDKVHSNLKLKVVYAGGRQPWQKIDHMIDFIESTKDMYDFEIYTSKSEVEKFENDLSGLNIKIESLPKEELMVRYQEADLGLIFRDDILVNNVANPTKLNEYIAMGIVPIMTSTKIGDFEDMGYRSISFSEGIKGVRQHEVSEISRHNSELYQKTLDLVQNGKKQIVLAILGKR